MTEEIIEQPIPEIIRIQGDLWEFSKQLTEAANQGYVLSEKSQHFPQCITLGVYYCEMVLPEKHAEIVPEEPKEPSPAQLRKEELVAALAEKVNLEEQAGAATPVEPPKRAGRPAKK